jgi:ABC-2 type transport system permease protein
MGRYLLTLGRFWTTSVAAEMEYRANFALEIITTIGNLVGSIFVLSLFYGHGHELGGWSWEGALAVLGVYTLLDGFTATLLAPNLNRIVTMVQRGTLDFVLLKPIDSQFWLSSRTFSPWGIPSIALGLAILLYSALRSPAGISFPALGVALVALGFSVLALYSLWFVLASTSIWFVKVWNTTEVLNAYLAAGKYPITAYPAGLRFFFTFVLPVAFLTTVPAEAVLGGGSPPWLAGAAAFGIGLFLVSRWFWRFAQRYYTSASS